MSIFISTIRKELNKIAYVAILLVLTGKGSYAANKYIHANVSWNTPNVWYDAPAGGNITTPPTASDDVYTNGYRLTVDGNFSCNNVICSNTAGAITVNSPYTLTIYGTLSCPSGSWGTDLIGGNGTIIMKKTSGTIIENWANQSTFENLIIDPGAGNTVNLDNVNMAWVWCSTSWPSTSK